MSEETKAKLFFSSNAMIDRRDDIFKERDFLSKIMKHILDTEE
jgi:uncharacterized membrane protein YebE (DUF533 family)